MRTPLRYLRLCIREYKSTVRPDHICLSDPNLLSLFLREIWPKDVLYWQKLISQTLVNHFMPRTVVHVKLPLEYACCSSHRGIKIAVPVHTQEETGLDVLDPIGSVLNAPAQLEKC